VGNSPIQLLTSDPVAFVLLMGAIVEAIALHEFAHAYAADVQGDRLPRAMGRLSLNPARHLDPLGTICIALIGFGWGKPVEFRPQALGSRRFGPALVALAGPLMNVFLAFVGAFAYGVTVRAAPSGLSGHLQTFFFYFFVINLFLAVFNLIPLPPLDGSRLLTIFLPPSKQGVLFFLDRYGFLILLGVVFLGGLSVLNPLIDALGSWLLALAGAGA
jgi:Zn-dependent protease